MTYRIHREPDLSFGRDWKEPDASWCVEILECIVAPRSERNPFGAVQTAYIDTKGSLIPILRLSGKSKTRPDSCAEDDVSLVTGDRFEIDESDLFAPDSINALELIDSSCYWLPLYNATRSRLRGLIVRRTSPGSNTFQRFGFAEFMADSSRLQSGGEQIVWLI